MKLKTGSRLLGVTAGIVAAYVLVLRPWHLYWGATNAERNRPFPGDELVNDPFVSSTRGITIRALAAAIWPWLVQMGYGRGGWYSYDRIDNDGFPSAHRIVPELQHLRVGDTLLTDAHGGFLVVAMEPNRSLVLFIDHPELKVSSSMLLDPVTATETRLLVRLRARSRLSLPGLAYYALFEPGDFVMMRRMLLNIREHVEKAHLIPRQETDAVIMA